MKKLFIVLCFMFLFTLTGCGKNSDTYENTEFTKLSLNSANNEYTQNTENNITIQEPAKPVETEVNSYSSPVLDKAEGRVNNLSIGCSYINRLHCRASGLHFLLMK